jgi:aromatic-L-amino-acid/L-tryptophan decarboxylase
MSDRGTPDEHTAAPVTRGSLDPEDWTGFRAQAHRMLDDMLEYMETMREYPVWQAIPDEVRAHFVNHFPLVPLHSRRST